ncbi:MAG TPA: hypothetical protein VHX60_09755 [Acidobacteriaceae bacterium]|jgi:hypothetical protein|nr:hypothetical protein [Acidobacteriaceae bacterium]
MAELSHLRQLEKRPEIWIVLVPTAPFFPAMDTVRDGLCDEADRAIRLPHFPIDQPVDRIFVAMSCKQSANYGFSTFSLFAFVGPIEKDEFADQPYPEAA